MESVGILRRICVPAYLSLRGVSRGKLRPLSRRAVGAHPPRPYVSRVGRSLDSREGYGGPSQSLSTEGLNLRIRLEPSMESSGRELGTAMGVLLVTIGISGLVVLLISSQSMVPRNPAFVEVYGVLLLIPLIAGGVLLWRGNAAHRSKLPSP